MRRATAQLALINDGARTELIAAAEADVASAQATLDQAKAALAETELKAPFAGTIAELTILPGEQAAPDALPWRPWRTFRRGRLRRPT